MKPSVARGWSSAAGSGGASWGKLGKVEPWHQGVQEETKSRAQPLSPSTRGVNHAPCYRGDLRCQVAHSLSFKPHAKGNPLQQHPAWHSPGEPSCPFTSLVALLWVLAGTIPGFLCCGGQSCTQYSRWGLKKEDGCS